jgi:hypothetical protein
VSMQRYAVEFGNQLVGVAFRVAGGFMFIASDPRFDKLDGEVFPRARALARRLGEMCDTDQLTVRRDDSATEFATRSFVARQASRSPVPTSSRPGAR